MIYTRVAIPCYRICLYFLIHACCHLSCVNAQSVVYQHKEDGPVKTIVRFGKAVEEFFLHESISERWERLERAIGAAPLLPQPQQEEEAHPVVEDLLLGEDAEAMAEVVNKMDVDERAVLTEFEVEATRTVSGGVKLLDGTLPESTLAAQIKASSIGQLRGGDDGYVLVVYDVKDRVGVVFKQW